MGNRGGKTRSDTGSITQYGSVSDTGDDFDDIFTLDDVDTTEQPLVSEEVRRQRARLSTVLTEEDKMARDVDHKEYVYPFENLVFEGGGNKGLAYCGALKEMEELGMLKQVKRLAGASAGAMVAALLSVGFSSEEIKNFMRQDLRSIFIDHSCGYLSLLPNLIRTYGWNPGKKVFHWFCSRMEEATGNRDITFREVYEKFGKELCIVVTNLNQMTTTYCHIKTTPEMPVAVAVRMSMAIPGMFSATKYTVFGHTDVFVDGGVLCNYPVHCFDGWWLSMAHEDSYLYKLQPLSELIEKYEKKNRFGAWNYKTLGFLLYSDNEQEMYRTALESRRGAELPKYPDTKLAKKYLQNTEREEKTARMHLRVAKSVDAFLKVLKEHDVDKSSTINEAELDAALKDESFTDENCKLLFGNKVTAKEAYEKILGKDKMKDSDNGKWFRCWEKKPKPTQHKIYQRLDDEEITYQDIVTFLESRGVNLHSRFLGYRRRDVTNLAGFLDSLQSSLVTNAKRAYMEEKDVDRTVGINTGYLQTTDFTLEEADKDYLDEQGRRSFVSFLKYYVVKNNPPTKTSTSSIPEEVAKT